MDTVLHHLHEALRIAKSEVADLERLIAQREGTDAPSNGAVEIEDVGAIVSSPNQSIEMERLMPRILPPFGAPEHAEKPPARIHEELSDLGLNVDKAYLRSWLTRKRDRGELGGTPGVGYTQGPITETAPEASEAPSEAVRVGGGAAGAGGGL